MMIGTDAVEVQIKHRLTQNAPHNDLFIELDDLQGNPVAAFNSPKQAAAWLKANSFQYVEGSSGVWTRKKVSLINLDFLDGRAITNRQLYKRQSWFSVSNFMFYLSNVVLAFALCTFVYTFFG
jgi:hypothetical protein